MKGAPCSIPRMIFDGFLPLLQTRQHLWHLWESLQQTILQWDSQKSIWRCFSRCGRYRSFLEQILSCTAGQAAVQRCCVSQERWWPSTETPVKSAVLPYCFLDPPYHSNICLRGFCLLLLLWTKVTFSFSEFISWVLNPGKPAGSAITSNNGSHSCIVCGKKKWILWLNVMLPSAGLICCLFILVLRDTRVLSVCWPPCLSVLRGSAFMLVISFLNQHVLI